jgi:hypothetical protein
MPLCVRHHFVFRLTAGLLLIGASQPIAFAGKPAPPPPPPVTYNLTFLDTSLKLSKMNGDGVAVGWTSGDSPLAEVVLADSTVVDLTTVAQNNDPSYVWSLLDYAIEINNNGQIAGRGWRNESDGPHARLFRYTPPAGSDPGYLEAFRYSQPGVGSGYVAGINDYGLAQK